MEGDMSLGKHEDGDSSSNSSKRKLVEVEMESSPKRTMAELLPEEEIILKFARKLVAERCVLVPEEEGVTNSSAERCVLVAEEEGVKKSSLEKTPIVNEDSSLLAKDDEDEDEDDDDPIDYYEIAKQNKHKYLDRREDKLAPDHPSLLKVADRALREFNAKHYTDYKLEKIIEGTRRPISGYEYILTFAASHLYESVKVTSLFYAHFMDFVSQEKTFRRLTLLRPFYKIRDEEPVSPFNTDTEGESEEEDEEPTE